MDPLGSAKEAFLRGAGAGAATSAINYLSDLAGRKSISSGAKAELLSGIAGTAVSPFVSMRDPRRGCGSTSPFKPSIGYSTARGYRYDAPQTANQSQSQRRGFSLKEFLGQTLLGGLTGGFSSAAFYGAGKGIERLVNGFQSNKGSDKTVESLTNSLQENDTLPMKMDLQFFANKRDIEQINKIAKKYKMGSDVRRGFGDYIESLKTYKRNDANFTWKELEQLAESFLRGE